MIEKRAKRGNFLEALFILFCIKE